MLEYRLLGRFEVRADGRLVDLGTPKQRAVLAILLLERNWWLPRWLDRRLPHLDVEPPPVPAVVASEVPEVEAELAPSADPRAPAQITP